MNKLSNAQRQALTRRAEKAQIQLEKQMERYED